MNGEPLILSDDLKVSGDTRWVRRDELVRLVPAYQTAQVFPPFNPRNYSFLFDDFIVDHALGSTAAMIGETHFFTHFASSSAGSVPGDANHPGVVRFVTGAAPGRHSGMSKSDSGTYQTFLAGSGQLLFEVCYKFVTSSAIAAWTVRIGFGDVVNADPVDGIEFYYISGSNSNHWMAQTSNNSSRTNTDTGVAANNTNWHILRAVANSAGTSVDFYIDDVLVATNVANIPTAAGRETNFVVDISSDTGAIGDLYIDYVMIHKAVTR